MCAGPCLVQPLYFDVVIRSAIEEHHQEGRGVHLVYHPEGRLVGERRKMTAQTLVTDLEYVDNMALVASSWSDLETMLVSLNTQCTAMSLSISQKKTKTLAVLPSPSCQPPVTILLSPDADPVEPVTSFPVPGKYGLTGLQCGC